MPFICCSTRTTSAGLQREFRHIHLERKTGANGRRAWRRVAIKPLEAALAALRPGR